MNLPLPLSARSAQSVAHLVESWVYSGLLHFWRTALPLDHAVFQLMEAKVQGQGGLLAWTGDWPWVSTKSTDSNAADLGYAPIKRLIQDFELTPASFFVLALAGQLENSHLVNLAVSELQAPDRTPRLSLHLAAALAEALFGESLEPVKLASHLLCVKHLLGIQGDQPLPLQRLHTNPWLWALLIGKLEYWPGVRQIDPANQAHGQRGFMDQEAAIVARLLQSHHQSAGVILRGNPQSGRHLVAVSLARHLGLKAVEVPLDIWTGQSVFRQACRYAGWLPVLRLETAPSQSLRLSESPVPVAIIVSGDLCLSEGNLLELPVDTPAHAYRHSAWNQFIPDQQLCEQLASCARLSNQSIQWVAASAQQLAERAGQPLDLTHVAEARLRLGVDKLRLLAQPVFRRVDEHSLVTTALVKENLQLLIKRAHQRESLWSGLGKTLAATPNAGVRALFVGESGTGKTLAASFIATSLAAPLYRVDLSAVMNKYIGESEKNLAQLLDQAAASDVVLLFDEADALFGSRSNGQETGERFANMLTNFLLTRIEAHPGIVILTTNSRERIDTAFTRRLDAIIEFPMPDFEERLHLWRSHLGERGPGENVYRALASYCDLAGGQVRNVVLTAAVVAGSSAIQINHLLEGLKAEYRKQGREMPRKLESLTNISVSN